MSELYEGNANATDFSFNERWHKQDFYYSKSTTGFSWFPTAARGRDGYIYLSSFMTYLTDFKEKYPTTMHKSPQPDKYRQGISFEEVMYPKRKSGIFTY
ncbi:MAG: hypothetical protein LBS21_07525 [Clostridiales bacterium]|jgi:hypothetical protein|nr:hypothetical protein [Clostridiales bacterium]